MSKPLPKSDRSLFIAVILLEMLNIMKLMLIDMVSEILTKDKDKDRKIMVRENTVKENMDQRSNLSVIKCPKNSEE
jgi:hypothetical protein